jgi:hypothetical protein
MFTRFRRPPEQDQEPAKESTKESEDESAGGAPGRGPVRRVLGWVMTVLACVVVAFALIAPNDVSRFSPGAFVRIPLEGLLAVALILVLPRRAKRPAAYVIGVVLGLLAIIKVLDLVFFLIYARPFNLVLDWSLFSGAVQFFTASIGQTGAIGVGITVLVIVAAVLGLMTVSVLRLSRVLVRHSTATARGLAVFAVAWVACALFGAQLVSGANVAGAASSRLRQVPDSLRDGHAFAREEGTDAFRGASGSQLLTGLRGKDVLLAFVESYGRDAIDNPRFAPQVDAALDQGTRSLKAAGFGARSGLLTSPTAGGGSWLAHGTLLSGLWIDNQQRYDKLVKSDRLTLPNAFGRAGWRTVAVMPGTVGAWPEQSFYGYQQVYDRWHLGYNGPRFNWGTPPDQFTLSEFQRAERAKPGHAPVMAEIPLVSSHAPWAPTPKLIDWNQVGDGKVFGPQAAAGAGPASVWSSPNRVRDAYRDSIVYTLNTLITYVEKYGDKNLVLVFLGDHQAAPIVTGENVSHDVPITIVAKDPAVLNKIADWHWQDGLRPGEQTPVWKMDTFRDRFLTAFGSQPGSPVR